MSAMTYEQFLAALRSPLRGERLGQRAFNILYREKPFLAESIRNEPAINPYVRNTNMARFVPYVKEHWDD